MHIVLLSLTLLFQTAVTGEGTKTLPPLSPRAGLETITLPPSPTVANTSLVSDYRVFAQIERTYTETPAETEQGRWRETYGNRPRARLDADFKALPGLTSWRLRGIDDGVDTASLRLVFKTLFDLEAPILEFQYQPQCQRQLAALARYLEDLPTTDQLVALPDLQLKWSEEILLPPDFVLASPLAEFQKTYGPVALHRTAKRLPGRVQIATQCTLTQTSVTSTLLAETLTALKQLAIDPPLTFQAKVLDALATEAVIPAMAALRDETADSELAAWATIQRAAAFRELFLPKLGVAVLDAALEKSPKEVDLLRARVMLGLPLRHGMRAARPQMIACLDRLLEKPPLDAARLRLEFAKYLSQANLDEPEPSLKELERAAEIWGGLGPEHWDHAYSKLLVTLGDFEAMARLLAQTKVGSEGDRRMLKLCVLAGRHKGPELDQFLSELEPEIAKSALEQTYSALVACGQVEVLRVLGEHAGALLEPKQLAEIEAGVREARILPSSNSAEGMYRQWLRAISGRDRDALDRLVRPKSLALDRTFFEQYLETGIKDHGLKWPFGMGEMKWEGDPDTGYRLEANGTNYFFTGNQEGYRLVTMARSHHLAGQYILDLLDQGKLESACRWLDWYFPEGGLRLKWIIESKSFWNDQVPRTKENAVLAAQAMALTGPGRERARQAMRTAFEEATGLRRDELALLFVYTETELDDWMLQADFTLSTHSRASFLVGLWQCSVHGRCEMIDDMCEDRSDDIKCRLMATGMTSGYAALLAAIESLEEADWQDPYGEMLLHFALLEPEVPEIPGQYLPERRQPDLLSYYAERNMIEELLFTLSDWQARPTQQDFENYLLGCMAEAFSEPHLARAFFTRLPKNELVLGKKEGLYYLASKHLDRLGH